MALAERAPAQDAGTIPRYPVVFMHGMGLTAHLLRSGDAFTPIVDHLREHGIEAFAPRVPPYNPTASRAEIWAMRVRDVLETTGRSRVNLLGFSTGGLDARYLVSRLGGHRFVASVTTVAAPHRGSSLAQLPLRFPAGVRTPLVAVVRALARRAFPDVEPDVEGTLRELHAEHMTQAFNPAVPDHPDVTYASWAAQAGRDAPNDVSPLVWLFNRYVYRHEGVNDGFVSVESARWTGYRGRIDADHAQLVGISERFGPFDARAFYRRYAYDLARQGF